MKKGFTLIELLVVIAIIAILAAILFPVFAQARLAAKKTQGLAQAKQIGIATQLYINDFDDVLYPYRHRRADRANINPDYFEAIQKFGQARADVLFGSSTRQIISWSQMTFPYVKSTQMYASPGNPFAWVKWDESGSESNPQFRSYGGQNSYGASNYLLPADGRVRNISQLENVSNTLLLVDARYYNVLPRGVMVLRGDSAYTLICGSSYPEYWKHLGNSYLFQWNGSAEVRPTDDQALALIQQRYSGVLNVVNADTSAKGHNYTKVLNDVGMNNTDSMWDPFKQGFQACP